VPISKEEQIQQRRAKVLELSAQGLTQQEIADKLSAVVGVSQQTISRDLEYLEQESIAYVRNSTQNIAIEYRKVMSNFYQLRKLAWDSYNNPNTTEDTKLSLYNIIQNINNNIMNLLIVSDSIEAEILANEKQKAKQIQSQLTVDKVH
jgi:hypothetical protein